MIAQSSLVIEQAHRFSIAPMLDCTDRHFRMLMRQISRRALLYTEMVVANALHHNSYKGNLLNFNRIEKPIALQIGGDNPKLLAEAAISALESIQRKYKDLMSDQQELHRILDQGRSSAEAVAQSTLIRLQSALGLLRKN